MVSRAGDREGTDRLSVSDRIDPWGEIVFSPNGFFIFFTEISSIGIKKIKV